MKKQDRIAKRQSNMGSKTNDCSTGNDFTKNRDLFVVFVLCCCMCFLFVHTIQ